MEPDTDETEVEKKRVEECPICGESYETAFRVTNDSYELRGRMYNVSGICFRNEYGKYYAYLHGEAR